MTPISGRMQKRPRRPQPNVEMLHSCDTRGGTRYNCSPQRRSRQGNFFSPCINNTVCPGQEIRGTGNTIPSGQHEKAPAATILWTGLTNENICNILCTCSNLDPRIQKRPGRKLGGARDQHCPLGQAQAGACPDQEEQRIDAALRRDLTRGGKTDMEWPNRWQNGYRA